MKKLLLILLCVPLIFSCGEENNETEKTNTENKKEVQIIDGIAYYENKIFKSSVEVIYYKEGALFTQVIWGDGKPGRLGVSREGIYNNKKFTGKEVQYDEDGKLFKEITFKDGKKDGLYRRWKGGSYFQEYYKDGELDGLSERWIIKYEDGFEDGEQNRRKDGTWSYHKENGQLQFEKNYIEGKLISSKCWDEVGNEIDCE